MFCIPLRETGTEMEVERERKRERERERESYYSLISDGGRSCGGG